MLMLNIGMPEGIAYLNFYILEHEADAKTTSGPLFTTRRSRNVYKSLALHTNNDDEILSRFNWNLFYNLYDGYNNEMPYFT